jgi:hypothetical protein
MSTAAEKAGAKAGPSSGVPSASCRADGGQENPAHSGRRHRIGRATALPGCDRPGRRPDGAVDRAAGRPPRVREPTLTVRTRPRPTPMTDCEEGPVTTAREVAPAQVSRSAALHSVDLLAGATSPDIRRRGATRGTRVALLYARDAQPPMVGAGYPLVYGMIAVERWPCKR